MACFMALLVTSLMPRASSIFAIALLVRARISATIPVSLPDNTDTAHVIIYVDGVIQYDDTCSTSGGSTSISVSGSVGDHDVTVSVDGSTTSQTYTFS